MARFTKEELLKNAAPYFSQGENVMYATADGNYFYEAHRHHAISHKNTTKTEMHTLTKEEFENLGKEFVESPETNEEMPKRGRKPSKS